MKKVAIENINIGDTTSVEKTMTLANVMAFADISGDKNPIHLDRKYAEATRFKGQLVHGMMAASMFSSLFGTEIPGEGCVYKSQSLSFRRPIYIGDTVLAQVTVTHVDVAKKTVKFRSHCLVNDKIAINGEAEIFIP